VDVWHGNAGDQATTSVTLAVGASRELQACGAPQVLLCFRHCWQAVGTPAAKAYLFHCYFHKEECSSMLVHIDRKRLDGNAIAFVLIILLIVIAFAY
jgi:hypothetical protein